MGGVLTDADGRSTVKRLWACGEVASTGAHGANRLASNSLLEAVVFGARIADDISDMTPGPLPASAAPSPAQPATGFISASQTRALRRMMSENVGVERNGSGLAEAVAMIDALRHGLSGHGLISNMLTAAAVVAATALARQESRGGHYRLDFNSENPALAHRSHTQLVDGDIEISPPGAVSGRAEKPNVASYG